MKKLFRLMGVLLLMSVASAQAQRLYVQGMTNFADGGNGAGASIIFGQGFALNLGAMVGVSNIAGPFGFRGGLSIISITNQTIFGLAADALFNFGSSRSAADVEFYAGGGFRLQAAGTTTFGINGVVGVEAPLNNRVSFVGEFVPILTFGAGTVFAGNISAGLRVYF